jgi:hypothetical protein
MLLKKYANISHTLRDTSQFLCPSNKMTKHPDGPWFKFREYWLKGLSYQILRLKWVISTRLFVECSSRAISLKFMYDKPLPHKMIDALVQLIYIDYYLVPDFTI